MSATITAVTARGPKGFSSPSVLSETEGNGLSRYANLLALAGIYIGILGLTIAAGSPDVSRQYGSALADALFA